MILRFLCTLLFLTTIGCYSVNEEDVDEPNLDVLATTKQEKALKLKAPKDVPAAGDDVPSPYDDETPIKAVKYKNYGYFNPSVATLKISRQAAVPKPAALSGANPAAFQFRTDRNLVSLMSQNASLGKPVFHFQRRLDEAQVEMEEVEDTVNVGDKKVRPFESLPNRRSINPYQPINATRVLNLRPSPHYVTSRRYYQRSYTGDNLVNGGKKSETSSKTHVVSGNDVDFDSLSSAHPADKKFNENKVDKIPSLAKSAEDPERAALTGSQSEFADIAGESEESNRAADVEFDREYRRLPFSGGRFARRKVARSLADPPQETLEGASSSFFIPTPIPGFQYPKSEEDSSSSEDVKKGTSSKAPTESSSPSTYFLPTRPAGASSEEVQSVTDGLSSFYASNATETTESSARPMFFVTAPIENSPAVPDFATVEEEINEKKNFSIEDFYNAFSANVTEYPNRHRDPDEGSSVTTAVNTASTGSFLALAPHFPLSPVSWESSRAIKYPCTCDKGKCGCCTGRIMSNFNINIPARGCLNITYIPEDFEFLVKMTYNDRTLAQRKISGKNPRPLCAPLPRLTGRAQACVKLSNVYLVGRNVHMCLDLEAIVQNEELFKVSFDCVRMGTNGIKWIKPEDGGGLGPPPVVEGPPPEDYDSVVASEGDEITEAKKTKKDETNLTKVGSTQIGSTEIGSNKIGNTVKESVKVQTKVGKTEDQNILKNPVKT